MPAWLYRHKLQKQPFERRLVSKVVKNVAFNSLTLTLPVMLLGYCIQGKCSCCSPVILQCAVLLFISSRRMYTSHRVLQTAVGRFSIRIDEEIPSLGTFLFEVAAAVLALEVRSDAIVTLVASRIVASGLMSSHLILSPRSSSCLLLAQVTFYYTHLSFHSKYLYR